MFSEFRSTKVMGSRVPRDFFVTSGVGESDITVHAGSYHLALRDAGIEQANHITYSSILPAIAHEVGRPAHHQIVHGSVMESITAVATCEYGESATAGLVWGWLTEPGSGRRHGGLVCEYHGSYDVVHAEAHLKEMLDELHSNGYQQYLLTGTTTLTRTVTPTKMYGTALVAMCFLNFVVPVAQ